MTWLLAAVIGSNRQLSGPDKAGAAIVYFMLTPLRWLPLGFGLLAATGAGAFAWIGGTSGLQYAAVVLVHAGFGAGSVVVLAALAGARDLPAAPRAAMVVLPFVVPLAEIAYVAWAMNPGIAAAIGAGAMIALLLAALALGAATGLAAWAAVRNGRRRTRVAAADRPSAPAPDHESIRLAALGELAVDAPLEAWLPFADEEEPIHVRAWARAEIGQRAALADELAATLAGAEWARALDFVQRSLDSAPAGLAAPVRDALLRRAEAVRARVAAFETPFPRQYEAELGQAVDLAERFAAAADFRPPLRALRDIVAGVTDRTLAPLGRARLDDWLNRNP
ncbi:MAG: hypothetical protein R3F55_24360 [Alphaproteobacteria bacterium]